MLLSDNDYSTGVFQFLLCLISFLFMLCQLLKIYNELNGLNYLNFFQFVPYLGIHQVEKSLLWQILGSKMLNMIWPYNTLACEQGILLGCCYHLISYHFDGCTGVNWAGLGLGWNGTVYYLEKLIKTFSPPSPQHTHTNLTPVHPIKGMWPWTIIVSYFPFTGLFLIYVLHLHKSG